MWSESGKKACVIKPDQSILKPYGRSPLDLNYSTLRFGPYSVLFILFSISQDINLFQTTQNGSRVRH